MTDLPLDATPDPEGGTTPSPPRGSLYLRRAGEVRGPFPAGLLARHLELGRLAPGDEVSEDRITWWPLDEAVGELAHAHEAALPALVTTDGVDWREERRRARRRWIDERSGQDRRARQTTVPVSEARTGSDRRRDTEAMRPVPQQFGPEGSDAPGASRRSLSIVLAVVVLLAVAGVCLWLYAPRFVPRIQILR